MQKTLLYESELAKFWTFSEPFPIFYCQWLSCEDYTDKKFRENVLKMVDYLNQASFVQVLDDSSGMDYPIAPDLQNWAVEVFAPALESLKSLQKYALILPKDLISMLSNEQIADDLAEALPPSTMHYEMQMFQEAEAAWEWLGLEKPV